jgi:hypothetical protein
MAKRIYTTREDSWDDLNHVAVAITCLGNESGQQHVGIFHKDESINEIRLLHLWWHNKLKNSLPRPTYAWVIPSISLRRARQVAALCRKVFRQNSAGIPYAFSTASDCFDTETGAFLIGPGHHGLTCASFVLAVFHTAGLPLVDYKTWPRERNGDKEWQELIIEQLTRDGASLEHIRAIESELGAVRYRPEDVAGACAAMSIPVPFIEADICAQEMLRFLSEKALITTR